MRKHILRYGTNADQKYFINGLEDCYDLIAINANMIAFAPNAIAMFVSRQTVEKPFFVDPITHLFQHSQGFIAGTTGDIKKSIADLIRTYAGDLQPEGADIQVVYDYIKGEIKKSALDNAFISAFVPNVLNYQKNFIKEKSSAEKYASYVEFAKNADASLADLKFVQEPDFLVAPYFYVDGEEWIDKNILLLNKAKELDPEQKIFAQIVISKQYFDRELLLPEGEKFSKLIQAYTAAVPEGFLLWIDGFSEHEQISASLKIYIELLKSLKKIGKPVYSLYGGFLSTLLTSDELGLLGGVAHGLEYGESREVVPVGGGIPTAKFYFYSLHKRVNMKDMIEVIRNLAIKNKEDYFSRICDCPVCKEVITSNSAEGVLSDFQIGFAQTNAFRAQRGETFVSLTYPTKESKDRSVRHYLYSKKKEFENVSSKSVADINVEMTTSAEEFKAFLDSNDMGHLIEWTSALEDQE